MKTYHKTITDKFYLQALGAESLSKVLKIKPEKIYNWLINHNIDLNIYGFLLIKKENFFYVLDDILNDEFKKVLSLIEV